MRGFCGSTPANATSGAPGGAHAHVLQGPVDRCQRALSGCVGKPMEACFAKMAVNNIDCFTSEYKKYQTSVKQHDFTVALGTGLS